MAWMVLGRVAKALGISRRQLREVLKMSPFPKWVGYLTTIVAVASAAFMALHPGDPLPGWITTLTTIIAGFTHSLSGTGGKTQ